MLKVSYISIKLENEDVIFEEIVEEINRKAASTASRCQKVSQQSERGLKPEGKEVLRINES